MFKMTESSVLASLALKMEKKRKRQKRHKRGQTLIKKAYEMSAFFNADVCLGIKLRDTGKIMTFCADKTGVWSSFITYLVFHLTSSMLKANSNRIRAILYRTKKRQTVSLRE